MRIAETIMENALILAAGEGRRLSPITLSIPKVLVPINGVSLIDYHLYWLKRHGVTEVIINLHYLGFKIEEHLGDGSRFGLRISYSREEKLLGTAGGAKRVAEFFSPTFVILYGDVLTNLDLSKMLRQHKTTGALATLALHELADVTGKGVVSVDRSLRILSFEEKPAGARNQPMLVNGGIYILNREILNNIDENNPSDFGIDILPKLLKTELVQAYILSKEEFLIDIGTMSRYHEANKIVAEHTDNFPLK